MYKPTTTAAKSRKSKLVIAWEPFQLLHIVVCKRTWTTSRLEPRKTTIVLWGLKTYRMARTLSQGDCHLFATLFWRVAWPTRHTLCSRRKKSGSHYSRTKGRDTTPRSWNRGKRSVSSILLFSNSIGRKILICKSRLKSKEPTRISGRSCLTLLFRTRTWESRSRNMSTKLRFNSPR